MKLFSIITIVLSFCLAEGWAVAQGNTSKKSRGKTKVEQSKQAPVASELKDKKLNALFTTYRQRKIPIEDFWTQLVEVFEAPGTLSSEEKVRLLQAQSEVLLKANYPVIAATYAINAIASAKNPLDVKLETTWDMLSRISRVRPIQYLLEDLARDVDLKSINPPGFGNDWNYIIANSLASRGQDSKAMDYYNKLELADRYFMPAKYQTAMIHIDAKKISAAETALKSMILRNTINAAPIVAADKLQLWNYANLALARLYYQERSFLESAKYYRKITKTSSLYYNALFEQSWSLFMSGNPMHSLGSLYGADSPYFNNQFNPEGKVLEAIVYYWMCRYEDSRNSLADFAVKHAETIEALDAFLSRKRLGPDAAYQLFEDLMSGVSSESLGIPRNVLLTAADKDNMLLVRDQLATALSELQRLDRNGVFGNTSHLNQPRRIIDTIGSRLKKDLGRQFADEMQQVKSSYDELYSQSQFLYLELMMSEKEQLLGRELHSSTKVNFVSKNRDIRGWGRLSQSWAQGKGEFWWDEIGFHIINVQPKCQK